jgi:hypothetical protein
VVSDVELFGSIKSRRFGNDDLIKFLKREELFWKPINNHSHRSRLQEIVELTMQELAQRPVLAPEQPMKWTRLVERVSNLPWIGGAQLKVTCLRLLWLFSPETVVRWDEPQCAGLQHLGFAVPSRVDKEREAIEFVKYAVKDFTDRKPALEWAAKAGSKLNEGEPYPLLTFIYDRMLAFEGLDSWRKRNAIVSLMQDPQTRGWLNDCSRDFAAHRILTTTPHTG